MTCPYQSSITTASLSLSFLYLSSISFLSDSPLIGEVYWWHRAKSWGLKILAEDKLCWWLRNTWGKVCDRRFPSLCRPSVSNWHQTTPASPPLLYLFNRGKKKGKWKLHHQLECCFVSSFHRALRHSLSNIIFEEDNTKIRGRIKNSNLIFIARCWKCNKNWTKKTYIGCKSLGFGWFDGWFQLLLFSWFHSVRAINNFNRKQLQNTFHSLFSYSKFNQST